MALIRYQGRLNRAIRDAMASLQGFQTLRSAGPSHRKAQKQTHFREQNRCISVNVGAASDAIGGRAETAARAQSSVARMTSNATTQIGENGKTNPLTSMFTGGFTGNRHERRRALALARRKT